MALRVPAVSISTSTARHREDLRPIAVAFNSEPIGSTGGASFQNSPIYVGIVAYPYMLGTGRSGRDLSWHAGLVRSSGIADRFAGAFRTEQGWIGGSSPRTPRSSRRRPTRSSDARVG